MYTKESILSPQDHEHFLLHGYVVVPGLVPLATAARAVAVLEADEPTSDFDPAAACTTDGVHQVIGELFGDQYSFEKKRGGNDMARLYQADVAWRTPVAHVDDAYPTLMPNGWAVGTFIFLTKVQSHGGAFIYFSGSPLRYRQGMAQSFYSIKEVAAAPDYSGDYQEFLAEPGDVLFFHHLMGHTGSDNTVDRVIRHALLTRWHPTVRVVPGAKDFAQMSTIEKANSARYMEARFGVDLGVLNTPVDGDSAGVLDSGCKAMGQVVSYALLHFGGRAQLLFVREEDPAVIRRLHSDDLIHWQEDEPLSVAVGPVRSLQLHQYGFAAVLAVTYQDGMVRVYASDDFVHWMQRGQLGQGLTATPWYVYARYPSKLAEEQALYVVSTAEPSRVVCRWGQDWPEAAGGGRESVAVQGPEECRIDDLVIAAYFSDSLCAVVADVQEEGKEATRPFYIQPQDVAVAEEVLQPLAYTGEGAPSRLRVFNRGRSYWLVTFLRRVEDGERLFWGFIDWEEETPIIRSIATAADFDRAKSIVGMI
ncbi:MAG: hypothetical protein GKR89_13800 [Candidatus Latescibacteria bacterium]|nr:hypothetical protein [Candidatus Latescibacterota bacterium]